MSVTINAKGTSIPFFKIGKSGTTLYQGSIDPSLSYTVSNGDYWLDNSSNSLKTRISGSWLAPKLNSLTLPTGTGLSGQVLATDGSGNLYFETAAGTGTVTSVSVVTANGISGTVSNSTISPAITLSLGAITPTSVAATGTLSGSNFSGSSSGTNTGDQTITLTGDVTGSGTGSFATTLATVNSSPQTNTFTKTTINGKGLVTATSSVTSTDILSSLGYTPVNKAGDTMTNLTVTNPIVGSVTGSAGSAGNATTATVLATARTISLSGDITGSTTFDGSSTGTINSTLPVISGSGDGVTHFTQFISNNKGQIIAVGNLTATGAATGTASGSNIYLTLADVMSSPGNYSYVTVNSKGLVTTAGNMTISGDIFGTAAGGNITVTLPNINSDIGSYTGVVLNAKGQVTAAGNLIATGGDVTGTASGLTIALNLNNVNSSPVTSSFQKVTTNSKGLITSTSAVTTSDITTALGYTPVNKNGDTMTGLLVLSGDPVAALGAVTKQYADNIASGVTIHTSCETATSTSLPACTYNNGSSGVGATLTANANGSIGAIGGYSTLSVGSRILIKDQTNQTQNGIYSVTQLGSISSPWILTRASDFDGTPTTEVVAGDLTYVQEGTNSGTQWVQINVGTGYNAGPPAYDYVVIGTDNIIFTQFAGSGTYTAGSGISIATNTISNTGVLSVTGTTNQITTSTTSGVVTVGLPSSVTVSGTITAGTFSGSGASLTNIPSGSLTNNSLTIGSTNISLGGTATSLAGLTSVTSNNFSVNGIGNIGGAVLTTSTTTANQIVDSNAITTFRAISYKITVTSGSAYEYTEVNIMHDGTNTYANEINTMLSGSTLATFSADISGGNMRLLVTPVNAITTIKAISTAITV